MRRGRWSDISLRTEDRQPCKMVSVTILETWRVYFPPVSSGCCTWWAHRCSGHPQAQWQDTSADLWYSRRLGQSKQVTSESPSSHSWWWPASRSWCWPRLCCWWSPGRSCCRSSPGSPWRGPTLSSTGLLFQIFLCKNYIYPTKFLLIYLYWSRLVWRRSWSPAMTNCLTPG